MYSNIVPLPDIVVKVQYFLQLSRVIAVSLPMLLVIPLLFGLCFQLFVLAPIRVSEYQMPLLFLWQVSPTPFLSHARSHLLSDQ